MKFMEQYEKAKADGYSIAALAVADAALALTDYEGDDFEHLCMLEKEAYIESDVDVNANDCEMAVQCCHLNFGHWDFSAKQALRWWWSNQWAH